MRPTACQAERGPPARPIAEPHTRDAGRLRRAAALKLDRRKRRNSTLTALRCRGVAYRV